MHLLQRLYFLIVIFLLSGFTAFPQTADIEQVRVSKTGEVEEIILKIAHAYDNIYIHLNGKGQIVKLSQKHNNQVVSYDYYDERALKYLRGKSSKIGNTDIAYYNFSSINEGRVKELGMLEIEYDRGGRKRVVRVGDIEIVYYSYTNEYDLRNYIRYIGDVEFQYYTYYDDIHKQFKLSAINHTKFDYFTELDNEYKAGKIKSVIDYEPGIEIIITN